MKKTAFKTSLTAIILLTLFVGSVFSVTRENDELSIQKPVENEALINKGVLEWTVIDSDQKTVPYMQLDLFSLSCDANGDYYATITDNSAQIDNTALNNYAFEWDTTESVKNKASIEDGDYCLRICATLLRDKNYYYSLCDTRSVSVENNNRKPQILSTPTKLNYFVGDAFAYQINAYDPDNDTLTFSKITGPSFINVNESTGLVSSVGKLAAIGSYTIKIRVTDTSAAYAEQIFTLNIQASGVTPVELAVSSPKEKDVIKTDNATVRWTISSTDKVSGFNIYYSKDGERWEKIGQATALKTSFNWNLDQIQSGSYYIKVETTMYSGGSPVSAVSGKFAVDKSGGSIPLIKEVIPAEESNITETKPVIGAVFDVGEGNTVNKDQTAMSLDDNFLSDCTTTDNTISCTVLSDLPSGRHKAKVVVMDSLRKSNTKEWYFEITTGGNGGTDNNDGGLFGGITIEQLKQIGGYLCCLILIVFLGIGGWYFIRKMIRRKKEAKLYDETIPAASTPSDGNYYGTIDTTTMEMGNFTPPLEPVAAEIPASQPAAENPSYGYQDTAASTLSFDPTDQVSMPSSYTSEEIPDWLKTTDPDKPISITGGDMQINLPEDTSGGANDIARPHE